MSDYEGIKTFGRAQEEVRKAQYKVKKAAEMGVAFINSLSQQMTIVNDMFQDAVADLKKAEAIFKESLAQIKIQEEIVQKEDKEESVKEDLKELTETPSTPVKKVGGAVIPEGAISYHDCNRRYEKGSQWIQQLTFKGKVPKVAPGWVMPADVDEYLLTLVKTEVANAVDV